MLAKVVNDTEISVMHRSVHLFFASKYRSYIHWALIQACGRPRPWPICTGEPAASSSAHFT